MGRRDHHRRRPQGLLRTLIEKITVAVVGDSELLDVTIVWAGGHETTGQAVRPVARLEQLSYYPRLIARIRELDAAGRTARQIADALNIEGLRPPKRTDRFGVEQIRTILHQRGVHPRERNARTTPAAALQPHEWSVTGLAAALHMPTATAYTWIYRGWVTARRAADDDKRWIITADPTELDRLRQLRERPPGYHQHQRWNPPKPTQGPEVKDHPDLTSPTGGSSRCRTGGGRPARPGRGPGSDSSSPCHHSHRIFGFPVPAAGQPGDLQPDQGALDDGHRAAGFAVGALVRVQPLPRAHLDPAVGVVVSARPQSGFGPGRAGRRRRTGRRAGGGALPARRSWCRPGEELAVVASPAPRSARRCRPARRSAGPGRSRRRRRTTPAPAAGPSRGSTCRICCAATTFGLSPTSSRRVSSGAVHESRCRDSPTSHE